MKTVVTFLLALLSYSFYAQITRDVGQFTKVTVFDQIKVELVQSAENKIIINGIDAESVELINKNGELKIRMTLLKVLAGEDIFVKVFFQNLYAIEANEGSRISSTDIIKAVGFAIVAKEGGIVDVILECKKVSSKISSGAIVDLDGTASNQDCIVSAGGVLNASKLKTLQTVVTCNAGGVAEVFASDYVNAKVRAGGSVFIYGKPKVIDQKVIIGGTIIEK